MRYAHGCCPADLFVKYFTSSKEIRSIIAFEGTQSFQYQIRKICRTREQALKWENTVLRRMKVLTDTRFFNKTNNFAIAPRYGIDNHMFGKVSPTKGIPRTLEVKLKISKTQTGKIRSSETRQKMSKSKQGQIRGPLSNEHKSKISAAKIGIPKSAESKAKQSATMKGRPSPNKGKRLSDEQKQLLSSIHTGKTHSDESKLKMSVSKKGVSKPSRTTQHIDNLRLSRQNTPKRECEYCYKLISPTNYVRWHGERCLLSHTECPTPADISKAEDNPTTNSDM